jgi:RNA polymerase-interacting CarD/CdnL/TRCF family regulator
MGLTIDYRKEIVNVSKALPEEKLKELVDFAQFLRMKREKFSLAQVKDSAEYVRKLREEEGRKFKSGKEFIEELIKWQKSES